MTRKQVLTHARTLLLAALVAAWGAGLPVALAQPAPEDPFATTPSPPDAEPPSLTTVDADLRVRARQTTRLHGLPAGLDEVREGAFHRVRLGASFQREDLSAYLQLQSAGAMGDAGPDDEPLTVGLQQGWLRWDPQGWRGLRVSAGRMALEFGAGRQIGRYDYHEIGHAFDGLDVGWAIGRYLDLHLLAVQIRRDAAQPDQERRLTGLYATGLPTDRLRSDLYVLYVEDGHGGEAAQLLTMGLRLDARPVRGLSTEGEAAVQVGVLRPVGLEPIDHVAMMGAARLAYEAVVGLPMAWTLHAQFWSGDRDATDQVSSAWRPLYGSLDEQVGLLQLFPTTNLGSGGVRYRLGDTGRPHAEIDARAFTSRRDAPIPGALVAPQGGGKWPLLGSEVDVLLHLPWRTSTEFLIATGVFLPARPLRDAMDRRTGGQITAQWRSRF